MGSTLSAPWAYLQKQGWPWMGIPASLEIFLSWSVKLLSEGRTANQHVWCTESVNSANQHVWCTESVNSANQHVGCTESVNSANQHVGYTESVNSVNQKVS